MKKKNKKLYSVSIDKPCSENWQEMLPSSNGRYCLHCAKTVVDFTSMTDSQISAFITEQKSKGKSTFCGRFRNEQLNRPLLPEAMPEFNAPTPAFALPLLLAGALNLSSCEVPSSKDSSINAPILRSDQSSAQDPHSTQPLGYTSISGTVTNSAGDKLHGAYVQLIGTDFSTQTQVDGTFVLHNIPEGNYEIFASYNDYSPLRYSCDTRETIDLQLKLYPAPQPLKKQNVVMGGIGITLGIIILPYDNNKTFTGDGNPVPRKRKGNPRDTTDSKK